MGHPTQCSLTILRRPRRIYDTFGAFTVFEIGPLTVNPKPVTTVLTDGASALTDPAKVESFVGAMEVCSELASALNGAVGEESPVDLKGLYMYTCIHVQYM